MRTTKTIDFVDNATTKEAAIYAVRYTYVFYRNLWRSTNKFAHKLPWVLVCIVIFISLMLSAANIMSVRAERDSALKKQAQLQERVEQLSCALEARKETAR